MGLAAALLMIGLAGGAGKDCSISEIRFSYRTWESQMARSNEESFAGQGCSGVAYGYAIALVDVLTGSALACLPEKATYNDVLNQMTQTIHHNEGWIDESGTAMVIAKGVTETFPCKKKKF